MQVSIHIWELNKEEEMIWNLYVMCYYISLEVVYHGKILEQTTRKRNMKELWRRN